jgi:prepilin signal peptidase PulO-like enzyme (type II secretory pathway)
MIQIFVGALGILGLLIGSFLNVLILRMHTGKTLQGRSECPHCGHTLTPIELIPVLSFIFQRGKCTHCQSKISVQYPLVELLTGVIFWLIGWRFISEVSLVHPSFLLPTLLFFMFTFSLLIVVLVYDIQHFIIPDLYIYLFAGISLVSIFIDPSFSQLSIPTWMEFFAGPLAAFPFAFLWFISEGRWMGFGDAKLALGIGWLLGPFETLSALYLSFWVGALYGIFVLALRFIGEKVYTKNSFVAKLKQFTISSEVPFAPFLVFGLLLVFFFHINVLDYFIF